MRRKYLYAMVILTVSILFAVIFLQIAHENPHGQTLSTIDFTETYSTISTIYQRQTFFADGAYWLFYCNGSHLLYTSSTNGLDWNTPTALMKLASASALSLWYDGKIHYALAPGTGGEPIIYQEGSTSDGHILWDNQRTAVQNVTGQTYFLGTKNPAADFGTLSQQPGAGSNKTQLVFNSPAIGSCFVFTPEETVKNPYGMTPPTNCTGKGWRTENTLDLTVSEGLSEISVRVSSPTEASHSGKALLKIWKIGQDDLQRVNLTDWVQSGDTTFQSTNKDMNITFRSWLPETTFINEYLFIEFGWQTTIPPDHNQTSLIFVVDETTKMTFPTYEYYNAYCTVDSEGYPWVAYQQYDGKYWTALTARATSTEGSSWASPTKLSDPSLFPLRTSILSMSEGRMYVLFASELKVEGRLWNGTTWGQLERITDQSPAHDYGYSAVSLDNEIHLVLLQNATNSILHCRRLTNGTWEKTTVETNQASTATPVLSIDPARTGVIYCAWLQDSTLEFRKWENGIWKKGASVKLDLTSPAALSCFYYTTEGKLGIAILDRIGPDTRYELRYYISETF